MITVRGISKSYDSFMAVDGISFDIQKGEIVGLLGPNGAGKTTTLKMLSGFMFPDTGTITVDGKDITEHTIDIKKKIGYLPETNPLYHDMKVSEFLEFAGKMHDLSGEDLNKRIEGVAKATMLMDKVHHVIGTLSKGYKQRVGLAQALIHQPEILILDEPTEGLDPTQRLEIRDLIKSLGKDRAVILSSHVLPEVEATCDRMLIINAGKIVASGTPAELRAHAKTQTVIFIKIEGPLDDIREKLKHVEGVERIMRISQEGSAVAVELECDSTMDLRKKLVHWVANNGWDLVEISLKETSLEDVFVNVTK